VNEIVSYAINKNLFLSVAQFCRLRFKANFTKLAQHPSVALGHLSLYKAWLYKRKVYKSTISKNHNHKTQKNKMIKM
jgi:hypothetical protein